MREIIRNILQTKMYLYTIIFGLLILSIGPLSFKHVIIPTFKNEMVSNILDEAKRVAGHLSHAIDYENLSTKQLNERIDHELEAFQIHKIHYFANDGKVIYSTNNDKIGTTNTHDYFHNIVAKGELYYKIVSKGDTSSEKDYLTKDIIEIYIPIMEEKTFHSAFELYYDISDEIASFRSTSTIIMNIIMTLNILGSLLIFVVFYIISNNNLKIKKYQKRLKDLAEKDPLTELYNRRSFFEISAPMIRFEKRNSSSMSIAMIDIDDFKHINDTLGHQCGDYVIKSVAKTIKASIRESDILARYGGEEFIILFPETNLENTNIVATKICHHVETLVFDSNLKCTVSIGISDFTENQTIEKVIHEADTALYNAKRSGKNRVIQFINDTASF